MQIAHLAEDVHIIEYPVKHIEESAGNVGDLEELVRVALCYDLYSFQLK